MASTQSTSRWNIHNKLTTITLEVSRYKRGYQRQFENLSPGQTKTYQSIGGDGRIALRVQRPNAYRVEFGDGDFPNWIEVDPRDQTFNTVIFPNGDENDNEYDNKNVKVSEPE